MHGSQYVINQSMHGSKYVTNTPTWEGCWLQSFSVHHTMKITKILGYKTLRCTNTVASSKERWTRENYHRSQFEWIITLHQVASPLMALKLILIHVYGSEKRNPTQIAWICVKNRSRNLNFVILDRYSFCRELSRITY